MSKWNVLILILTPGLMAVSTCDPTKVSSGTSGTSIPGNTPTTGDDDDSVGGLEICEGDDCACPAGGCDVTCGGAAACDVACQQADPCEVDCNGAPSCDVQSSGGTVNVDCAGTDTCDVECSRSDSCNVDCDGTNCDVSCPASGCEVENCGSDCTVICGFVPQFPSSGTVSCP